MPMQVHHRDDQQHVIDHMVNHRIGKATEPAPSHELRQDRPSSGNPVMRSNVEPGQNWSPC